MIKYQITDPESGKHSRFDTEVEAMEEFTKKVVDLSMRYTLGCPYIKVDIAEDGSETYFNDSGIELSQWINSETVQRIIQEIRNGT